MGTVGEMLVIRLDPPPCTTNKFEYKIDSAIQAIIGPSPPVPKFTVMHPAVAEAAEFVSRFSKELRLGGGCNKSWMVESCDSRWVGRSSHGLRRF